MRQTILIHPAAPAKPGWGEACNGCGVCCATEPCPVGIVVSGRRHGACKALQWDDAEARYRCGVMAWSAGASAPDWLTRGMTRLATRLIAAGEGCDCSIEVDSSANDAH
jgi:hypothetical protein